MAAKDHLSDIQFRYQKLSNNANQVTAHNEHGQGVGWLRWMGPEGGTFSKPHEVVALAVSKEYQRRGIATEMFNQARQHGPVEHSSHRTWQGEKLAKAVGGKMPRKSDGRYMKPMAPPPVGWDTQ